MEKIEITSFDIQINKEAVLKRLGCSEESSIYNTVSGYFDEAERDFYALCSPRAVIRFENMRGYCVLTLGAEAGEYSRGLFDKGEGMRGLLADAIADEYLFEMDSVLSERIKRQCADFGYGVRKRLEAPRDIPMTEQKTIAEKAGIDGVSVTEAFMLCPVKTLAYILEFTEDTNVFSAQHDCSKCPNTDCPRRSNTRGRFEILSGYAYKPCLKAGAALCV